MRSNLVAARATVARLFARPGAPSAGEQQHGSRRVLFTPIRHLAMAYRKRFLTVRGQESKYFELAVRWIVAFLQLMGTIGTIISLLFFAPRYGLVIPSFGAAVIAFTFFLFVLLNRGSIRMASFLLVAGLFLVADSVGLFMGYRMPLASGIIIVAILITTSILPLNWALVVASAGYLSFAVMGATQDSLGYPQITNLIELDTQANSVNLLLVVALGVLTNLAWRSQSSRQISDLERARQESEQARQEADRANQAKSKFLAAVSHELRTPLNAIRGYVDIMLAGMVGSFSEQQAPLLNYVQHNSKRLYDMINDLLDLSRIEAGRLELHIEPLIPRKVVGETVESMRSLSQQKGLELAVQYSETMSEVVLGDLKKVQQIITNLVGNAIKFTNQGSVTVRLSGPDLGHWQIRVEDTGIGMPPDAATYIFEMFRQVDSPASRKQEGTGLGLSITKGLVERMSGSIAVESTLGKGSAFTVTLPRQLQEKARPQEEQNG